MSRSLESDHRSDAYRHPIDPDAGRPVGTATAMGVAALERVDEAALSRVRGAVDQEAVEALLAHGRVTSAALGVVVAFP